MNFALKTNVVIRNESLGEVDNSSEEFCLIKVIPPWDTYFEGLSSYAIRELYLGIYWIVAKYSFLLTLGRI